MEVEQQRREEGKLGKEREGGYDHSTLYTCMKLS
jgi:hypothetical protein